MRVIVTALAFCVLSFVAGVAGDLSVGTDRIPTMTVSVRPASARVELPPHLANAVRARPLRTQSAQAAPVPAIQAELEEEVIAPAHKPRPEADKASRKRDRDRAPKPRAIKG